MNIEAKYPNLWKVAQEIAKQSLFQKKAVMRQLESGEQRYLSFAEDVTNRMLKIIAPQHDHKYLAETYLWYTKTIKVEELFFSKQGHYRYSDYDEVYEKVYGRDDYMIAYVVGLGMTQVFWPNHWEIIKFFQDEFIPHVKFLKHGAEIGVGHGIFHAELLRGCTSMRSKLLDISPVSLEMTRKMIAASGLDASRAEPIQCDIQKDIPIADGSLEALLMGELIEHIQHGETVMEAMASKMKPAGYCYFSTAANSPAEDHILLFRGVQEIRDFLDRNGWGIVKEHVGTMGNLSVEESERKGYNINYAAVLSAK